MNRPDVSNLPHKPQPPDGKERLLIIALIVVTAIHVAFLIVMMAG